MVIGCKAGFADLPISGSEGTLGGFRSKRQIPLPSDGRHGSPRTKPQDRPSFPVQVGRRFCGERADFPCDRTVRTCTQPTEGPLCAGHAKRGS